MDGLAKWSVPLPDWVRDVVLHEAALVIDRQGRLVAASVAAEQLLGWELTPRLGNPNRYETTPPHEHDKVEQWLKSLLSGEAATLGVQSLEVTHRHPSGALLPLTFEYRPVIERGDLALHLVIYGQPSAYRVPTTAKTGALLEATLGRLAARARNNGRHAHSLLIDHELPNGTASLSNRERQVLEHILDGGGSMEIAGHLNLRGLPRSVLNFESGGSVVEGLYYAT